MKLTVEKASLLKALGHVHRVVERRNSIAILSNVLLRTDGDGLALRATDLDVEVSEGVPAEIERTGSATVPAYLLHDIVKKLPDGASVTLELKGPQVALTSGRSRFALASLPEDDFPTLGGPAPETSSRFSIPSPALKALLVGTAFAISTEETRHYLCGVYMHVNAADGKLRAVATDGHRLARIATEAPAGAAGMPGVIVPRKTVAELQRLVDEAGDEVQVVLSASKVTFVLGRVVLTSKLIDGTFPDYQRVIPEGNDKSLVMDKSALSAAVDRVATVSSERGRAVRLNLSPGTVVLTVSNPDSGTATEEVEAAYDAATMDVGFNARYLLDCVGQLSGERVEFLLDNPGAPAIIRDPEAADALYVLMPMRV